MAETDRLHRHIREALRLGSPPQEIRADLLGAGWTAPEADAALAAWQPRPGAAPVPRPQRSRAAQDAFFYALLFVAFGTVAGNVLALGLGQIRALLPDLEPASPWALRGLRWSMAALIVFAPVFFWLDRRDSRALAADPAQQHGTVRRWLSALALLIASVTLLGDGLVLTHRFLDGQITARFAAGAALIALLSGIVLGYFRQGRARSLSSLALLALAALMLALSFATVGGPRQGQAEARDRARLQDLRSLASDVARCDRTQGILPDALAPLDCARAPAQLTALASAIRYERTGPDRFRLCTQLESPGTAVQYGISVEDRTACLETTR